MSWKMEFCQKVVNEVKDANDVNEIYVCVYIKSHFIKCQFVDIYVTCLIPRDHRRSRRNFIIVQWAYGNGP